MRICICDDERAVHAALFRLLHDADPTASHTVTSLYSGEALMAAYADDKPFDLIFLDVEMDGANGVEAAKHIRRTDETVMLVFVSGHRKYVFDAFPVGAMHYLLKPLQQAEFDAVYRRAMQRYGDLHAVLRLRFGDERFTIPLHRVLYVEGVRRHVVFHTLDGVRETVGKLSDYAEALLANGFAYSHSSFLVNLDRIERIEQDKICLQNGETIYCSVRKRADLLREFDNYLGQRKW